MSSEQNHPFHCTKRGGEKKNTSYFRYHMAKTTGIDRYRGRVVYEYTKQHYRFNPHRYTEHLLGLKTKYSETIIYLKDIEYNEK